MLNRWLPILVEQWREGCRQAVKSEDARTALAVVEWTLKQRETGELTNREGGEPITGEHVEVWRREIA